MVHLALRPPLYSTEQVCSSSKGGERSFEGNERSRLFPGIRWTTKNESKKKRTRLKIMPFKYSFYGKCIKRQRFSERDNIKGGRLIIERHSWYIIFIDSIRSREMVWIWMKQKNVWIFLDRNVQTREFSTLSRSSSMSLRLLLLRK